MIKRSMRVIQCMKFCPLSGMNDEATLSHGDVAFSVRYKVRVIDGQDELRTSTLLKRVS